MKHDLRGPSSLALRRMCPGSANLQRQKNIPEDTEPSTDAQRGTALHQIIADILEGKDSTDSMALIPKGDSNAVEWCVDRVDTIVTGLDTHAMRTEQHISLEDVGISQGTIDVLVVVPGEGVIVIDHKFGVMEVSSPQYNWQMKAYAWAAWHKYGGEWAEAIILQPEMDEGKRLKSYRFTAEEMEQAGKDIAGIVAQCDAEDAPVVKGWWCTGLFCKCQDVCPLWMNAVLGLPQHLDIIEHVETLEPDKRQDLYDTLKMACSWSEKAIKKLQAYMHGGGHIPGYEVGPGRNARVWGDAAIAAPALREIAVDAEINPDDLFVPESLKSVAQVEEVLGKSEAMKEKMSPMVLIVPGKPTIKRAKKEK